MAKTLSQQLCELCGIEASTDCNGSCNLKDKEKLCKNCKPLSMEYLRFKKICPNKPNPYYIDFERPENFVALIELKPLKTHPTLFEDVTRLCYFFNPDAFKLQVREDFLYMLVHILNGYSNDFIRQSTQEKIKQAIRNYDGWVWG